MEFKQYFYEKSQTYQKISKHVTPSMLGNILKKPFNTSTFLPKIGLFISFISVTVIDSPPFEKLEDTWQS